METSPIDGSSLHLWLTWQQPGTGYLSNLTVLTHLSSHLYIIFFTSLLGDPKMRANVEIHKQDKT